MTDSSQDQHHAESQDRERRKWVTPTVRRMSAGSAEDGFGNTPDGGQPS